jgi:hypothetical protein
MIVRHKGIGSAAVPLVKRPERRTRLARRAVYVWFDSRHRKSAVVAE